MTEADKMTTTRPIAAKRDHGRASGMSVDESEVIRLAEEVIRAEAVYAASYEPPAQSFDEEASRMPEQNRLSAIVQAKAQELSLSLATTLPGIAARARAARAVACKTSDGEFMVSGYADVLVYQVMEEILALESGA